MTQTRREGSTEPTEKPKLSVFQSVIAGSVAGAAEVFVNHPLWTMKTRSQTGEVRTFKPSVLYRGILGNATSMVPTTAVQVGLNQSFQYAFGDKELSNSQRFGCAFVAGMGSAVVCCPTEMVLNYQRKHPGSFYQAGKQLVEQGGLRCLFQGMKATMAKEGIFSSCFLAVTPMLKASIQPYCSSEEEASLLAAAGAGVGATLVSQAFDTVKSVQQDSNPLKPLTVREAAKTIYSTLDSQGKRLGMHGFFKGGFFRGARVVSALCILGAVKEEVETKLSR